MLQASTASRVACCGLQHTPCYVIQQHGKQYTYREPRDTVPYSMAMQSYIDNIPVDQHCIPQSSLTKCIMSCFTSAYCVWPGSQACCCIACHEELVCALKCYAYPVTQKKKNVMHAITEHTGLLHS